MNPILRIAISRTVIKNRYRRRKQIIARLRQIEKRHLEDLCEIEQRRNRMVILFIAVCFLAGWIALLLG
jgi:hypothetical protein